MVLVVHESLRSPRGGLEQPKSRFADWLYIVFPNAGKNPLGDEFVRPAREFAKSVTETRSKVREPKTYNEAISDLIHGNRWRKAVDEELWNLDAHRT